MASGRTPVGTVIVESASDVGLAKQALARAVLRLGFSVERQAEMENGLAEIVCAAFASSPRVVVSFAVDRRTDTFEISAGPSIDATQPRRAPLEIPAAARTLLGDVYVEQSPDGERLVSRTPLPVEAPNLSGPSDLEIADPLGSAAVDHEPRTQALERSLERSAMTQAKLELATSMAELGFWEVDPLLGVITLDERARMLHQVDTLQLPSVGALASLIQDPDTRSRVEGVFRRATETAHPLCFVVEYEANGRRLVTRGTADPMADGVRVVATVLDVTGLKRLEEAALDRARFHAELVGIVSHDLKSPLNVVSMGVTLLKEVGALDEKQRQLLQRIERANRRGAKLISDLLDFTRVRLGGGLPIDPRETDLAAVVERVLDESRIVHRDHDFTVATHGTTTGRFDADRLAQAISNLLENAVEHADDGDVTVELKGTDDGLRLSVENRGAEIAQEDIEQIFDPLEQVDPQGTRRRIGLGLYIVRQIARAHGGEAFAESIAGRTRFTLTIPR